MSSGDGWHGPIDIRGIKADDPAKPPARLEIRELMKNEKQWTLYLLGMERFQEVDERDPLSYFQIAGIHGQPYTTWPYEDWNRDRIKQKDDKGFRGFCTHTSIIFLTWHGPYLALFEWALHKHVTAVAQEFGTQEYIDAAKTFRIPYWDWALPADSVDAFPPAAFQKVIPSVLHPGDTEKKPMKRNPLGSYKYQKSPNLPKDVLDGYDEKFKILNGDDEYFDMTVRWSKTLAKNRDKAMADALETFYKQTESKNSKGQDRFKPGKNLTERTLYILQSYDKFKPMSNNRSLQGGMDNNHFENYGSIEDSHNAMHDNTAGEDGQMGDIAYSAFDPIFWLHHCNIDRLFHIWVELRSNKPSSETWVTKTRIEESTFTSNAGIDYADEDTLLYPFTNTTDINNISYWDSKNLQDTYQFGHCYPETQRWKYANNDEYVKGVLSDIQALYGGSSLAAMATASKTKLASSVSKIKKQAATNILAKDGKLGSNTLEQISLPPVDPKATQDAEAAVQQRDPLELIKGRKYLEWLVNVKGQKHALDGKWALHAFIGAPDDSNPWLYQLAPNYLGTVFALGQGQGTQCGKCEKDQADKLEITGQIPLTIALVERYLSHELESLEPDEVVRFLKKNLFWRVTAGGEIIQDRTRVTGLKVAVVSNEVTIPEDDTAFPIYAPNVVPHPNATDWDHNDGTGLSATA